MEGSDASDPRSRVERQRSPRPESTMALDFSSALDGAFNLGGELGELHQTVEQKKQAVTSQNKELEALEARLKAAEERLQQATAAQPSADVGQQESKPRTPVTQRQKSSTSISKGSSKKTMPLRPHEPDYSPAAERAAPPPADATRNGRSPGAFAQTSDDASDAREYYNRSRS